MKLPPGGRQSSLGQGALRRLMGNFSASLSSPIRSTVKIMLIENRVGVPTYGAVSDDKVGIMTALGESRVVIMQTLSSLVPLEFVVMTTSGNGGYQFGNRQLSTKIGEQQDALNAKISEKLRIMIMNYL